MISTGQIRDTYTPEMALVVLICRVYFETATAAELNSYLENNKIDWQLFGQIIAAHQVRPLVYKVLSVHSKGIDAAMLENLRTACYRIAASNLSKLEELVRLQGLFQKAGVIAIPYKGVILSQQLFGDYISRETVDIDFLSTPSAFPKLYSALTNDGYTTRFYEPAFEKQILRTSHELQFRKDTPAGEMKVEIHWAATNPMMKIPIPVDELLREPGSMQLLGTKVDVLNPEAHLLVLLVHHGVNDIWRTLRHTLDVCLFLQRHGDSISWEKFHGLASRYHIRRSTETGFLIAFRLFGIPVPPHFETTADPNRIIGNLLTFPAIKKGKLNSENFRQQLSLRDSFTDKLSLAGAYISTAVTPNIRDMEAHPLKRKWYALYYLIKPFRMLFRRK